MFRPLRMFAILMAVSAWYALDGIAAEEPARRASVRGQASKTVSAGTADLRRGPSREKARGTTGQAAGLAGYTPEREAAATTFVAQHHPELTQLLIQLKATNKKEYHRAIRDLFRISERLAQVQEEDPVRYEFELQAWKLRSRVQLLAARVQMSPQDAAVRAELKQALLDQIDHQRARLQAEQQRVTERLERIESQIERLEQSREAIAERHLKQLTGGEAKSGQNRTRRKVPKPAPAAASKMQL